MNYEIGKKILTIRKRHNLTQKEMGDILGVTSQAVSKWENGRGIPDIDIIKKISKEFNLDLNELINGNNIKKNNKNKLFIIIIIGILILSATIYFIFKNNNFEFATLSSKNNNFKISGVAAYSSDKKSIYISDIEYIGKENNDKYSVVECSLYESNKNVDKKISQCGDINEKITSNPTKLSNLLKNIEFNVGNYSSMCKEFKKHTLFLRINAKDENQKIITYDIPIELNENCND